MEHIQAIYVTKGTSEYEFQLWTYKEVYSITKIKFKNVSVSMCVCVCVCVCVCAYVCMHVYIHVHVGDD